jgi:transglutaminase-like putative cysteine protease
MLLLSVDSLAGEIVITPVPPRQVVTASVQLQIPVPVASGKNVRKNSDAIIDYSNTSDGYIMVRFLKSTSQELRALITTPNNIVYTYPLNQKNEFEVYPLSEGDGTYIIKIYEHLNNPQISNMYKEILSLSVTVKLNDQHLPFLYPNQYVNFSKDSPLIKKAAEFKSLKDDRAAINAINDYVSKKMQYDTARAADESVAWNIPDLDRAYTELTGICIDYAALMAAMARSIGIPTKLITGYTGKLCHAWVEVYLEPSGWTRMDPTVEALGRIRRNIDLFINDNANYLQMFQY